MESKNVLITGASRGIGAACALKFSANGFSPIINYHTSEDKANALAKDCILLGAKKALPFRADISSASDVEALKVFCDENFGFVDTLVLNAGIASYSLFQDTSEEEFDRVMDTNVKGAFLTAKAFIPKMISNHSGNIIILSSVWGQIGGSCEVVYSASKSALIGMTKALAKELGPSGIRVNCVAPGVVETDMTLTLGAQTLTELAEEAPLMRNAKAEEIANAVYFLASSDASFITGQVIGVNGGIC